MIIISAFLSDMFWCEKEMSTVDVSYTYPKHI